MKSVTKCVCRKTTFAEIKATAQEKGFTKLEQLIEHDICSSGCGMCSPYIKKMLVTGETAFRPGDYHIRKDII